MGKLAGIVVQLHHLLHLFQPQDLSIGDPPGIQNLIGRTILVSHPVFPGIFPDSRPLQNLQKAQLELMGSHGIYPVKGVSKALVSLQGKTRDQIQMKMDIPSFVQGVNHAPDAGGRVLLRLCGYRFSCGIPPQGFPLHLSSSLSGRAHTPPDLS